MNNNLRNVFRIWCASSMGSSVSRKAVVTSDHIQISPQQQVFARRLMLGSTSVIILNIFIMIFVVLIAPEESRIVGLIYYSLPLIIMCFLLLAGFHHRKLFLRADLPNDFTSYDSVFNSLRKHRIATFERRESLTAKIIRAFVGENFDFLINGMKTKFQQILGAILIFTIAIGISAISMYTYFIDHNSFDEPFMIFIIMIIYWIIAILSFRHVIKKIIPRITPLANVQYHVREYSGSHPGKLYRNINTSLEKLHFDYPQRLKAVAPQMSPSGIGDAGSLYGNLCLESYPANIDNKDNGKFMSGMCLALDICFIFSGCILLAPFLFSLSSSSFVSFLFFYIWFLILIMLTFYSLSRVIATSYFWDSDLIYIEFLGEYYRSNIGIGTGIQDALKSERLSVISDITIRYHGSHIISHSIGVNNCREIINMSHSQRIKEAIEHLDANIEVEKQFVDVQIPNIQHPNIQKLTDINLSIAQARNSASSQSGRSFLPRGDKPTQLLPESSIWGSNEINCPNCNVKLSSEAKFCDSCGKKINTIEEKVEKKKYTICTNCNSRILSSSSFCMHCGHDVKSIHGPVATTSQHSREWICNNCDQLNEESYDVCQWCETRRS